MRMELTEMNGRVRRAGSLQAWAVQPRRIGGRSYRGECLIARVRRASYRQQSTTFGSTSGTFGLTSDGRGFVAGGGGYIDTVHDSIVTVVLEDHTGRLATHDLPATASALEDAILRLDHVNDRLVAVTNITGQQRPILLLGPSAFIQSMPFTQRHGLLLLVALVAAGQMTSSHPLLAGSLAIAFGIAPVLRLLRMRSISRRKAQLGDYIADVMS